MHKLILLLRMEWLLMSLGAYGRGLPTGKQGRVAFWEVMPADTLAILDC
ncbi:hypothetical protein [Hymenobacter psoromatis]|nr:hypothetical protein [Hymenobacter psoromatis]